MVLYRRGTAHLSNGDFEAGNADITAAKAINPHIAEEVSAQDHDSYRGGLGRRATRDARESNSEASDRAQIRALTRWASISAKTRLRRASEIIMQNPAGLELLAACK